MRFIKWISFFFIVCQFPLVGDIIYLKNGRKIEGTVLEERENSIVFEMAMGAITYDRSKIDRIERNDQGDRQRELKQQSLKFKREVRALKRSVASLYSQKTTVTLQANKSREVESKIRRLDEKLLKARRELVTVRKDLEPYAKYHGRRVPARIYRAYNVLVTRHDSLVATITSFESEINLLNGKKNNADRKTMKSEQNYLKKLTELRERYNALISNGCPANALETIDRALVAQGNVLERQEIPLRRVGNSFIVSVRINDAVTADFLLDTGCSDILLNADLMARLKLSQDQFLGRVQSSIADGSSMEVQRINLQSVQVGSFTLSNVPASAQVNQTREDAPLLLGMSFLRHFHFSIDISSGNLILERIQE